MIIAIAILLVLLVAITFDGQNNAVEAYKRRKGVRVHVWRGPRKYRKRKFAPWGYYAKVPADKYRFKHG